MKNKIKSLFALLLIPFIASCASDGGSSNGSASAGGTSLEVPAGKIDNFPAQMVAAAKYAQSVDPQNEKASVVFYVPGKTSYGDRTVYMWVDDGTVCTVPMETVTQDGFTFGYIELYDYNSKILAAGLPANVADNIENCEKTNIIVKNLGTSWSWQTPDSVLPLQTGKKHFLVESGTDTKSATTVSALAESLSPSISAAQVTEDDFSVIRVNLSVKLGLAASGDSKFVITASDNSEISIIDAKSFANRNSSNRYKNFTSDIALFVDRNLDKNLAYTISREGFDPESGVEVDLKPMAGAVAADRECPDEQLGLTLNGTTATFRTWAPIASVVKLLLFTSSSQLETPNSIVDMQCDEDTGIWYANNVDVSSYKYYKYRISNLGRTNDVCDIYAKAASGDSVAAQITDINVDASAIPSGYIHDTAYGTKTNYYNPFGNSGSVTKKYGETVIYEMHIRDWSKLEDPTSTGKFLDIARGSKVIEHIKSLGVTHVQILPMFDYAEKNADEGYNWGYNPYHYNVPEGRYVTSGYTDGTQAVKELREMVAAFHDAGIAVIMDVVYNHTSGTGTGSLYDMTVPYYYYRMNSDGTYSNGSGCGNETDSSKVMYRKYMIESLKHWMLDYHINGFRFDLMGLHESSTMAEIYKELHAIDKNVMVYGEPWTGGDSPIIGGAGKADIDKCSAGSENENGVACFNDDFRNAIKGAEYPEFSKGECEGPSARSEEVIVYGLKNVNFDNKLGRSINYVECHDNLTLADKIALCLLNKKKASANIVGTTANPGQVYEADKIETLKKQDMLAASYMFLAPGTTFINGGQEFCRSKNGDENSYKSNDTVNGITQDYIDTYSEVTNYYRGLIRLRLDNPESFGNNGSTSAKVLKTGLIKYTAGDYVVFYNSNSGAPVSIDTTEQVEGYVVDIASGSVSVASDKTTPRIVDQISALIIKVN